MRARVGVGDAGGSEQNAALGQLSVQKAGRGDRRLPEATKQTKNKQISGWRSVGHFCTTVSSTIFLFFSCPPSS